MRFLESLTLRRAIQTIIVLWALLIIFLWIFQHHHRLPEFEKQISEVIELMFTHVISKIAWVLVFILIGYGLGRFSLKLFKLSEPLDSIQDDLVFSIATGWGIISLGSLLLGSVGLLQPALHVFLGITILILTSRHILDFLKRIAKQSNNFKPSTLEAFLILTIAVIALYGFKFSLLPERGFDSLNSHLPEAATYIKEGKISFHPEINFNNFPQNVQMWFMQSMMVLPEGASSTLMGVCHILTALTVFCISRRFFNTGVGLVSMLIYLLIKKVFLFATLAYIDQGLTFMLTLGTYSVLMYLDKPSRKLAILAGICFGFACGIKYSAFISVILIALIAIIYLFLFISKKDFRKFSLDFGISTAVLILLCCPWYIRNIVWFNNPFFPFFQNIFQGNGGIYASLIPDLEIDHRKMLWMFSLENKLDPIAFLLLPYSLTFKPYGPYDGNIGVLNPWFFISLPLIIFIRQIPRTIFVLIGIIIITYVYWWFVEGMLHLRYMMPIFALQAILAGFLTWEGLRLDRIKIQNWINWLTLSVLFATLVTYFVCVVTPENVRKTFPILDSERNWFPKGELNALPVVKALNKSLAEHNMLSARVYGYYMEQYRWFADFTLIGNQVGYADHADYINHSNSAASLYNWLKKYDCSYLIVNIPYAQIAEGALAERAIPSRLEGWETYFSLLYDEMGVFIYELK